MVRPQLQKFDAKKKISGLIMLYNFQKNSKNTVFAMTLNE